MKNVVIVDGLRTPFGKLGGGLRQFHTVDMAAMVIKGVMEKTALDPKELDAVYFGTANGDAKCPNPARFASLQAGLPYETSAVAVEMQCGSAIASINHAAYRIQLGDADVVLVGGGESFSQRFVKFSTSTEPYKMIAPAAIPPSLAPKAEDNLIMLQVSDLMAKTWGVTREECDEFALRSQLRAKAADESGFLAKQIMPVVIPATKKTPEIVVAKDEHPRHESTIEGLQKLRPVYEGGVTTAGNASGRNDGASMLLMMSEEKAKALGYTPIARWVGGCDVGCDPKLMGIGPAYSNMKLMQKHGLKLSDIDVFECNEAFAAQNLSVIREMEKIGGQQIDIEKWNPNGGAIAFGHPNGASGGRVALFALHQLLETGGEMGIISSCCGGGLGVSALFQRI